MKQVTLVLINNGENVGTYSPFSFIESFQGNIEKKTSRCLSFDDDRQVETNLYNTCIINIPEWMTEQYYLTNAIKYHWSIALTKGWSVTLNQQQLTKLCSLEEHWEFFVGWLFKGKTKNVFKLDIREKVMDWLNSEEYKYKTPLSLNQFYIASKFCPLYDAKKISTNLYYSKSYWKNS